MKLTEYNTSLSGMLAAQRAMATTKQNISNLHTEGYVRQKTNLQDVGPSGGSLLVQEPGYGVRVASIERVTDMMLTQQYNKQLSQAAYYEYTSAGLAQAESTFTGSTTESLSSLTDEFFTGWHELAKHPTEAVYYQPVLSAATKWMSELNRISSDLGTMSAQAAEDLAGHVEEFNSLGAQLASTNQKIGEAGMNVPNELLNKRDSIIASMAKYAPIEVSYESQNPNISTVRLNGLLAVSDQATYPLQVKQESGAFSFAIGSTAVSVDSGMIRAALDVKEKHIDMYQKRLDTYANTLRDQVNTVLREAYTAGNGQAPAQNADGTYVTDFFTGQGAADLRVNTAMPKTIPADGLTKLAALADAEMADGLTYTTYLDDVTVQVAADVNEADSFGSIHQELLTGIKTSKASVEGVNMDEEMVNLMMYQNYFAANSKAIQTLNQMYDALFSIIS